MIPQSLPNPQPEMRDEYDLTGKRAVSSKYANRLSNGYRVVIHNPDGTTTTEEYLPASMVALAPDVQAYFPDAESVNNALRAIISILPFSKAPNTNF